MRPQASRPTLTALERLKQPDVTLPVMVSSLQRPDTNGPAIIGAVRPLERVLTAGASAGFTVRSIGATRVRLHLRNVQIGENETFRVYGNGGETVEFGRELLGPGGDLWTPSVEGDTISLDAGGRDVDVGALAHIVVPVTTSESCFSDALCSTSADRDSLSRSVAQLTFVSGSSVASCTGGLINAKVPDSLLLTANHCISTASEASSVEASWDWTSTSCGSTSVRQPLRTSGATLIATSVTSDVTLLRMKALPAGRWLMGWTTVTQPHGTRLQRIAHPVAADGTGVYVQLYSTTTVDSATSTCAGLSRPSFVYSHRLTGGVAGGSSGAPVIIDGGYIVGQLYGSCGPDPGDGCSSLNGVVDGSFAASWPTIAAFIDPQPTTCSACVPSATTACMLGNRFTVTMPSWRDTFANLTGKGSVIRYADNIPAVHPEYGPLSESAFFSMYSHAPTAIEALVRMIKGQNINNKYWVFVTGFAGAEYTINIQDTQTCRTWQRTVASSATDVIKDFEAFPFN
jgi:hypothetical protein